MYTIYEYDFAECNILPITLFIGADFSTYTLKIDIACNPHVGEEAEQLFTSLPIDKELLGNFQHHSLEELFVTYEKATTHLFKNSELEFENDMEPIAIIDIRALYQSIMERSSVLFNAIANDNVEAATPLLNRDNVDLESCYNEEGEIPFTLAVKLNATKVLAKMVVQMVGRDNFQNREGKNGFEVAMASGNKKLARYLLKWGWILNNEQRLNYLIQCDGELPDANTCSAEYAQLILKLAPTLSSEQKQAYRDVIDQSENSNEDATDSDAFNIASMTDELLKALASWSKQLHKVNAIRIDAGIFNITAINDKSETVEYSYTLENGFDHDAYNSHYDSTEEEQETSEYCIAMKALIEKLTQSDAFNALQKCDGFSTTIESHIY